MIPFCVTRKQYIVILIDLIIISQTTLGKWTQENFIIGCWSDPVIHGLSDEEAWRRLKLVENGHFNCLSGVVNKWADRKFQEIDRKIRLIADTLGGPPISGLKMMVGAGSTDICPSCDYDAKLEKSIDSVVLRYSKHIDRYLPGKPNKARDVILGYLVADEPPSYKTVSHLKPNKKDLGDCILAMQQFIRRDPEKCAWINLFANRTGHFRDKPKIHNRYKGPLNDFIYRRYVQAVINGGAQVISFDNYPFSTNKNLSPPPSKIQIRIPEGFYKNLRIISEESNKAQKPVPFWAMANCVNHARILQDGTVWHGDDATADYRTLSLENINFTKAQLQFQAFIPLLYGAKGIWWFIFESHCQSPEGGQNFDCLDGCITKNQKCPNYKHTKRCKKQKPPCCCSGWRYDRNALMDDRGNPTEYYYLVKDINLKLKNIGPIIMNIKYIGTYHGRVSNNIPTATDLSEIDSKFLPAYDYTGPPENNLSVINKHTPIISGISGNENEFVTGIFQNPQDSLEYFLFIVNKNIYNSNSFQIIIKKGFSNIYHYNFNTNSWDAKTLSKNNSTITSGDILPGDLLILKVN